MGQDSRRLSEERLRPTLRPVLAWLVALYLGLAVLYGPISPLDRNDAVAGVCLLAAVVTAAQRHHLRAGAAGFGPSQLAAALVAEFTAVGFVWGTGDLSQSSSIIIATLGVACFVLDVRITIVAALLGLLGWIATAARLGDPFGAHWIIDLLVSGGLAVLVTRVRTRQVVEAEVARRQSEAIIDAALDGVIVIEPTGYITAWSRRTEMIFGWSRDEVLGREIAELIIPPEQRAAHRAGLAHWQATGEGPLIGRRVEIEGLCRDGRRIPVALALSVQRIADQLRVTAFVRDLTERREEEVARASALAAAESLARERAAFLAQVSHEMRTPIHGIVGMAEIAGDAEDPQGREEALARVRELALGLGRLVDDILDLSRLDTGSIRSQTAPFGPSAVLESVAESLAPEAARRGLSLIVAVGPTVPVRMLGDGHRLRQVLLNLAFNAIKFTPSGSVCLALEGGTAPAAESAWSTLTLTVADTGIGMSSEQARRAFEPFWQADTSGHTHQGAGLGLAISRRIVEAMGGNVDVETHPSGGSVFRISLLLVVAEGPAPLRRIAAGEGAWVVHHDAESRSFLERTLAELGFEVRVFDSSAEALAELGGDVQAVLARVAVALVEAGRPGIDQPESRALRERLRSARVVVILSEPRVVTGTRGLDGEVAIGLPLTRRQILSALDRTWAAGRSPGPLRPAS